MEIERKWLVRREDIPFPLEKLESCFMEQRYVSFHPTIRIRDLDRGRRYVLTVKTSPPAGTDADLVRREYETDLTQEEYLNLKSLSQGHVILKRRCRCPDGQGNTLEIDLFEGEFQGLVYLEVEFESEEAARGYTPPDWAGREVTHVSDYKNAALAKNGMPGLME